MERSEPTLVPEWLKSSGNVSSGGSVSHQAASFSLHSDDHAISKSARHKPSVTINDHDLGRSLVSDQPTSSYLRRSASSNGSTHLRSYSSSGGNHPEKDWEKDIYGYWAKDKSVLGDLRHRDYLDPLEDILPSRFEKDMLRHSRLISMNNGKQSEMWSRKLVPVINHSFKSNNSNGDGEFGGVGVVTRVQKAAFDKGFPLVGAEERQEICEIGRVSSPGLSTTVQGSLVATAAVIGGPGTSSALAEVPVIFGNTSISVSSVQQTVSASTASSSPSATGLNMAEALAQVPTHPHTAPQSPVGIQRLEELAIIQSRRLIPVTPSMPKALVLSSSEKSKLKSAQQQQYQIASSQPTNHSPRGGPIRSDVSRTSNAGKLRVLKPVRERNGNGDGDGSSSSPKSGNSVGNSTTIVPSLSAGSAPLRSPSNNSDLARDERKPSFALANSERRPISQAQSRSDFFNLMRKKSYTNSSSRTDAESAKPPSISDNLNELITMSIPATSAVKDAPPLVISDEDCFAKDRSDLACSGNACDGFADREKNSASDEILYPDEKEAAFLRSLGWEESGGEDEGLTEEEITAFYKEYMKVRPSSKVQELQPKIPDLLNSQSGSSTGASSGLKSSDTESEC